MNERDKIEKNQWNQFILEQNGSFLQSFEWGEFQESVGRRVFRFFEKKSALSEAPHLRASEGRVEGSAWLAQFIENTIPVIKKKYWYCPKGPTMSRTIRGQEFRDIIQNLIVEVKKISPQNIIFFRLGPEWGIGQGIEKKLLKMGFKQLSYDIEPSQTLILDITKSEEELLAQMHEKWRYNIRLAQKKGVQIQILSSKDSDFEEYFERFYKLLEDTCRRQGIKHHPREYYKKQLELNPPQPSFKKEGVAESVYL